MDLSYSNTAMNFTENQQGSAVLEKLSLQKEAGRFCDIVFHVKDSQYVAHRCVLAACSPYFDSMLKPTRMGKEHLKISCEKPDVFETFLNYIYTGKVVIDGSTVTELLKLANNFMMAKLKEHSCEYMERNLNITNCFSFREQARTFGTPTLLQTVEYFIASNIHEIVKQYEITEFNQNELEMLFNMNYDLSEDQKLWILIRWMKCNLKMRESSFKGLLNCISWSKTNVSMIYDALKSDELFTMSEKCFFQLLQILEENRMLIEQYFDTYVVLKDKLSQMDQSLDADDMIQMAVSAAFADLQPSMSDPKIEGIKHNIMEKNEEDNVITQTMMEDGSNGITSFGDAFLKDETEILEHETPDSKPLLNMRSLSSAKNRGKHKRKGIPVKVKLPKSKLKGAQSSEMSISRVPRRRGRPPKKYYSDQVKRRLTTLGQRVTQGIYEEGDNEDQTSNDSKGIKVMRKGRRKGERVKCNKCFYVATTYGRLQQHIRSAHRDDTTFSCQLCVFKCKWNREYYSHMKTHFQGPPYKCDFEECDYTSERIQPLLHHRMVHTNERPFECTVCNMRFRTKNNLTTHLRCHTGVKPYKCDVCSKCFATKGTLEQHTVTHSDLRPYLCDTCGFSTKYQSHLIAHKRIHTGDVFKCQYKNCDYTTPKRSQLAAHMRIHLCIRSHVCSTCGRSFVEKSHLVRHERIHLDEKPFKCDQCEYGSTRRDKLKEHKLKHHGNNAPKTPYKPRNNKRGASEATATSNTQVPTKLGIVQYITFPEQQQQSTYLEQQIEQDFMKAQQPATTSQELSLQQMMASTLDTRSLGLMMPNIMPSVGLTSIAPSTLDTTTTLESRILQTLQSAAMAGIDTRCSLTLDGRTSTPLMDGRISVPSMDCRPQSNMSVTGLDSRSIIEIRPVGENRNHHMDLRTTQLDHLQGLDGRTLSTDQLQLTSQAMHSTLVDNTHHLSLQQQADAQQHADLTNLSAFMGMF